MIYSCPHCQSDLEIHSVHFGKELSCPECNKSFAVEEIPPVVKYQPKEIGFFQVFKVVIYTIISVLVVAAVCWGAYLAAKWFAPSWFKDLSPEQKTETIDQAMSRLDRTTSEKTVIYVQNEPAAAPLKPRQTPVGSKEIRQKNADAERQFLNDLNNAPEKMKK